MFKDLDLVDSAGLCILCIHFFFFPSFSHKKKLENFKKFRKKNHVPTIHTFTLLEFVSVPRGDSPVSWKPANIEMGVWGLGAGRGGG